MNNVLKAIGIVMLLARVSIEASGSRTRSLRASMRNSAERLADSLTSPDSIGASISWLCAKAEKKPDLKTCSVIFERAVSILLESEGAPVCPSGASQSADATSAAHGI